MNDPLRWLGLAGRFVVVAAGLVGTATTLLVAMATPRRPDWHELIPKPAGWEEAFSSLRAGMTQEEVVTALGPPFKVYRSIARYQDWTQVYAYPDYLEGSYPIRLYFDREGRLDGIPTDGMHFDFASMSSHDLLFPDPLGIMIGLALLGHTFVPRQRVSLGLRAAS